MKLHRPYHESDHRLNIAFNVLAGNRRLEHLETLRLDENYLDALGAERIPDPTTAGDFCRCFTAEDVDRLQDVFNDTRQQVWRAHGDDSSSAWLSWTSWHESFHRLLDRLTALKWFTKPCESSTRWRRAWR